MYQEQQPQPYVPNYPSYPNPNNSFTYQPHGIGNFGGMTSMASAAMHPAGNFGVATPPMTATQSFLCEVCDITCDTADVLATHKLGKKHLKNLQKQGTTSVIPQNMPPVTPANAPSVGKLEEKMQRILQNGASIDSLLHCDLCNVTCNNENAYQSHVASKKHVAKAIMQKADAGGPSTSESDCKPQPLSSGVFECGVCKISCTNNELLKLHFSGKKHQKNLKDSMHVHNCEICDISCDTNEVFINHLNGKKHKKNLERTQKASLPHNPVSTSEPVAIPTVVEPAATPRVVEPAATPTVVEPALTPTAVEPVATPTVVERVATPSVVGPVVTPAVVEPVATPTVVEPVATPALVKPIATPSVVEPVATPSVVERIVNPAVVEPVATPAVVEAVSTTTVVEVLQDSVKKDGEVVLCGASHYFSGVEFPFTQKKKDVKTVISHEVKPKCEVCNITCDTYEMLEIHYNGRKHQKNLKKLKKPSVMLQGSVKDEKIVNEDGSIRKGKRAGSQIDVESKKQKMMQPTSSKVCTVCNVVCNSPKMFDNHIAGQKHAAMVAKQARA